MKSQCYSRIILILFCALFSISITADTQITTDVLNNDMVKSGRNYFNQGQYEQALSAWNAALDEYKKTGDNNSQAQILHYKAETYLAIGQHYKATKTLELALRLAEKSANNQLANKIAGSLGYAYMLSNRISEARDLLEKTVKDERAKGNLHSAAVYGNNLGNLLASQGDFPAARKVYEQAILDAEIIGDNNLIAKGLANVARVMANSGDFDNILSQLKLATKYAHDLPATHDKSYTLINIGRIYSQLLLSNAAFDKKEIETLASSALTSAADSAETIVDKRAMSFAYGYLGELNEKKGNIDEAIKLTRQALFLLRGIDAPDISYRWIWQEGRLLKTQGHYEQAITAFQHAVDTLQKVRHILAAAERIKYKDNFKDSSGRLYMEFADLLLKNMDNITDKTETQKTLLQVRATVEMLKGAELENYFRDNCVTALKKKTKGIDQISKNTAAIYPVIFPERLEILLSLPSGMKRFTVAVSKKELNNEINLFRTLLEKRTTHQYKRPALKIYNWLIKPLENDLASEKVNTLMFIPDGGFRTIPLSALYDGKTFLISHYAIATTPGLTLTDPRPLPRKNLKLLVAGLSEGVQGFPPLPDVDGEVTKLNELYDATVIKNDSFTQLNVKNKLGSDAYSIVHVASHGKFKSDVRNTFLLTYDGKLRMDSLENYMANTTYRKNPIELLTLSACQTAVGDENAALGLGGIAVKAGARSALATLWYINDEASSLLIKDFYVNLKNAENSKAKALQNAQVALINDPRFKHPSYWAPFLLIGNWL